MITLNQIKDCAAIELGYNSFKDLVLNPKQDMQVHHINLCIKMIANAIINETIETAKHHCDSPLDCEGSIANTISILELNN